MRSRTAFSLFLIILPSLGHSGTKDATKEVNKEAAAEVMITHSEEKAIASLQEIIRAQKTQSDKSQYLHRLAELYLRRSKTSRFFENMSSQSPLSTSFPEVQGKSRKWLEEAIQIYNQIIQKDPKYASIDEVFFSTGFLHAQLSQATQARNNLKQALVANPNKYEAMLSLAELEYDQKNFRQAEGYYRQLVDLKVDMAKHFVKYKMSWAMYNQKNTQQALDNHLEVVMQIPESPYRKEALKDLALFIAETSKGENVSQTIPNEINKEDRKTLIDRIVGLLVTWSRAGEIKPLLEREILSFPEYRHEYQARLLTISFERKDLLTASQILNEFQTSCRFEDCTNVRPVVKTQLKNMWELEAKEKSPQRKTLMLSAFAVLLIDEKDLVTLQSYAEFLTEYKDNTPAAEAWMNLFDRSSDSAQKEDALYKSIHLTADGFDKEGKIDQFIKLYTKSPRAVEFLYVKALELAKSQDYAESLKILNDIKGRASAKDLNEKIASLITQVEYDQLVNSADPQPKALFQFAEKNSSNPLAEKAWLFAFSLVKEDLAIGEAIQQIQTFISQHPTSSAIKDLNQERVKLLIQSGNYKQAVPILESIGEIRWVYQLLKAENDPKASQYEKTVLANDWEPEASEILYKQTEEICRNSKPEACFNATKKLASRKLPALLAAKNRLLQSEILSDEFIRQSTKAKPDRLELVMSIKLEKFQKATTALDSTLKLSPDRTVSLSAAKLKISVLANLLETLKSTGIQDGQKNITAEIDDLKKQTASSEKSLIDPVKSQLIIPDEFDFSIGKFSQASAGTCKLKSDNSASFSSIAACIQSRDTNSLEKIAQTWLMKKETENYGIYLRLIIAQIENKKTKAFDLIQVAKKRYPPTSPFLLEEYKLVGDSKLLSDLELMSAPIKLTQNKTQEEL